MRIKTLLLCLFVIVFSHSQMEKHDSNPPVTWRSKRSPSFSLKINATENQVTFVKTFAGALDKLADEDIASMFKEIKNFSAVKFVRYLKAFSVLGDILGAFMETENEEIKKIEASIEKLSNQLTREIESVKSEIIQLKSYVAESLFNYLILDGVEHVAEKMNDMIKARLLRNRVSKKEFLRGYNQAQISIAAKRILSNAKKRISALSEASNFNETLFNETKYIITNAFFQSFTIRFFAIGLDSETPTELKEKQESLAQEAERSYKKFVSLMHEVDQEFYTNFYPGRIKEEIIKKMVDQNGGVSNCQLASTISQELGKRYPWRNYTVIVSNTASGVNNFYEIGDDSRKIILEGYNGRNVIALMASTNFTKNYNKYRSGIDGKKHKKRMNIRNASQSLQPLAQHFSSVAEGILQVTVLWEDYKPCEHQTHSSAGHVFRQQYDELVGWDSVMRYTLFFAVNF